MTTFTPYYDSEHECVITNKSDEAFVNGWAQEINLVEVRKKLAEEEKKKDNFFTKIIKILRKLGGKK